MATVTVIGTGNMGQAISRVVTEGGHTVEALGQDHKDKQVGGDIVILAVPYSALADIVATRGDQLAGKIVVDITNPVNFQTFDALTVAPDSSAAAELAAAKSQLADVVTSGGLKAIDAGSLKRARELEAVGFLQISLAAGEKVPWTGDFGVVG